MGKKAFIGISLLVLGILLGLVINRYAERIWPHGARGIGASANAGAVASVRTVGRLPEGFAELARAMNPSVVSVAATGGSEALGSGVVISATGHVVTSAHLVAGADALKVGLNDGQTFSATLIGLDTRTDLAVLKFPAPAGSVPLGWADSDKARVGEYVLAVGNPFGLEHTVTMGIISAKGRAKVGMAADEDFIQTDAGINPGNSGGPLVDASGSVVGIVTGAYSQAGAYPGIGFAVPSNLARAVTDALVRDGRMLRGWIGATVQDLTPELAMMFDYRTPEQGRGVLISDVVPGGPAGLAGLRRGDIIIKMGEHTVDSASGFGTMMAQAKADQKYTVTLYRDGKQWRTGLAVAQAPNESEPRFQTEKSTMLQPPEAMWGVTVVQLTEEISRQLGLRADDRYGVVVSSLVKGSASERAGLRRGDVIQRIGERRIATPGDFGRAVSSLKSSEPALLFVNRGAGGMFYLIVSAS